MAKFSVFGGGAVLQSAGLISGGVISIHSRNIATIQGDGGVPNTVTVTTTLDHNLTTADTGDVAGTAGYNESTPLAITVTGAASYTYQTSAHTLTTLETVGTIAEARRIEFASGLGKGVDGENVAFGPTLGFLPVTSLPSPGDAQAIFLSIDGAGSVVERPAIPDAPERRATIDLGLVARFDTGKHFLVINTPRNVAVHPVSQLHDFMEAVGPFTASGIVFSKGTGLLEIQHSGGQNYSSGCGFRTTPNNPHRCAIDASPGGTASFSYKLQDGTDIGFGITDIDPDNWDNGGTLDTVPVNKFTVQLLSLFPEGAIELQPGQEIFNSIVDAEAKIDADNLEFVIPADSTGKINRSFLIIREGTTDLSSASDVKFRKIAKFGGGGGGTASTIQDAYDLSTDGTIVTDATRGPFSVKEGTGDDTKKVVGWRNGAGAITSAARGDGVLSSESFTTSERDALSGIVDKDYLYNSDRERWERFNGTHWMNSDLITRTNRSGGTLNPGAPVVQSTTNDDGLTSTTTSDDINVLGTIVGGGADDAAVTVATDGLYPVLMSGEVALGDGVISSTTAQEAIATGSGEPGIFAVAAGTRTGGGTSLVDCWIQPTERF